MDGWIDNPDEAKGCKNETAYKLKHLHDSLYYQRIIVPFTLGMLRYIFVSLPFSFPSHY